MPKFRKKPTIKDVVEAVVWNGHTIGVTNLPVDLSQPRDPNVYLEFPPWLPKCMPPLETESATREAVEPGQIRRYGDVLFIGFNGPMSGVVALATPGDWIVHDRNGMIFPCKPDIFAASYEMASASGPLI